MSHTEIRKVLRDLKINSSRTILAVLAIAIGLIGSGLVMDAYAILSRELAKNYMGTNPAAASIFAEGMGDSALSAAKAVPGVKDAELRRRIVGRIKLPDGEWKPAWFFVVPNFRAIAIDTFSSDSGAWPPAKGEVLIERVALQFFPATVDRKLTAKIPLGGETALSFVGTTYAPGLAPAFMERVVYCYASQETAASMGAPSGYDELKISLADGSMDKARIRSVAEGVADRLREAGFAVSAVQVPEPGQHPHYTQMMTLLYLLGAFGFMALALSAVLAATMISSVMAKQIREIGIMKAIGAGSGRIMLMYFSMVGALGLAALAISLPASIFLGTAFSSFAAGMLNFRIFDPGIPAAYFVVQAGIGILVPIAVSAWPIIRGARVSVREAISDYGIAATYGQGPMEAATAHFGGFSRPLLLSLRNAFRRRGRMMLTLGTLAFGGAVFITAMNVGASLDASVVAKFKATAYDLQLKLSRPYPSGPAVEAAAAIPGVKAVEAWSGGRARLVSGGKAADLDFPVIALPPGTKMLASLPLVSGRWLKSDDRADIVINQRLLADWPGARVGSKVTLRIGNREGEWTIVGIVREFIVEPAAYASLEYFASAAGQGGMTTALVIVATDRSKAVAVGEAVEGALRPLGIDVAQSDDLATFLQALREHFMVLAVSLALMTLMVVAVGGMGLASTMSVNVLERRREIGVMRAIGAGGPAILGIVVVEGAFIGALSWALAVLLSWPVSAFLTDRFGMIFFESPLRFTVSPLGFAAWLGLSAAIAALSSLVPALRATGIPVREALAYE